VKLEHHKPLTKILVQFDVDRLIMTFFNHYLEMPRATELTDFERGIIVGLHLGGKHTHQEIAAIVRRSKGAVQGVIERYIDGGFTTVW
ncbi:8403_t:CDS:1, partial [Paraglomus occultum]